jgi:hypothetical protein
MIKLRLRNETLSGEAGSAKFTDEKPISTSLEYDSPF